MSIIPTGPARLFLTNASGERQEIGIVASGNISIVGGPFSPFASGGESEEITLTSGPLFGMGMIRLGYSVPMPLGSGLIASGQIFPMPVRSCACCKRESRIDAPGQVFMNGSEEPRYRTRFYCSECTGYTKEKGIITRKDLILARAGLLPETPIPILLDFLEDHDFPEEDIEYMRRFVK